MARIINVTIEEDDRGTVRRKDLRQLVGKYVEITIKARLNIDGRNSKVRGLLCFDGKEFYLKRDDKPDYEFYAIYLKSVEEMYENDDAYWTEEFD